jgi:hypothetical protein
LIFHGVSFPTHRDGGLQPRRFRLGQFASTSTNLTRDLSGHRASPKAGWQQSGLRASNCFPMS